jgi:hypothetical protein
MLGCSCVIRLPWSRLFAADRTADASTVSKEKRELLSRVGELETNFKSEQVCVFDVYVYDRVRLLVCVCKMLFLTFMNA